MKDDNSGTLIALEQPLLASEKLEIYGPIILNPEIAGKNNASVVVDRQCAIFYERIFLLFSVFPWDPVTRPFYNLQYSVLGGSTPFLWSSSNSSIATVSQNGIAKTQPDILGDSVIKAAMMKASHNFGIGKIYIIPAAEIDILEVTLQEYLLKVERNLFSRRLFFQGQLEVEIGKTLPMPLSMSGNHRGVKTTFSQCHPVPFEIGMTDQKVFETPGNHMENVISSSEDEDMAGACTWVDMKARTPGFSRIKVTYTFPALAGNTTRLTDDITLAAFKPLAPVQPSSGETLLSVESSLQIVWTGGPLPWINKPEYHFLK